MKAWSVRTPSTVFWATTSGLRGGKSWGNLKNNNKTSLRKCELGCWLQKTKHKNQNFWVLSLFHWKSCNTCGWSAWRLCVCTRVWGVGGKWQRYTKEKPVTACYSTAQKTPCCQQPLSGVVTEHWKQQCLSLNANVCFTMSCTNVPRFHSLYIFWQGPRIK